MKIAITGGTGFIGRHLARTLSESGHQVVLIARGVDKRDTQILQLKNAEVAMGGIDNENELMKAFQGCDGVAHCAGINREKRTQTYQRVHVDGTRHVVEAAKKANVKKIALMSFLRARADCGSPYHESKWEAEEILRSSGLDYTILKAGVIYGKGDHMLDHLSHALYTVPIFASVGFKEKPVRPVAVEDVVVVLAASLVYGKLSRKTVVVVGPEKITMTEAVRRISKAIGRKVLVIPLPVFAHTLLAWAWEKIMPIPLISTAQVRMLSEGMTEVLPFAEELPIDLQPKRVFSQEQIKKGLPAPGSFF